MSELFAIAPIAILIAIIAAFAVVGMIRHSRTFLVVAVALGAALVVATNEVPGNMPDSLKSATRSALMAVVAALVWVALTQEPVWLAYRLGFIRRSPEWEFDVVLSELWRDFNARQRAARDLDIVARRTGKEPPAVERAALMADARRILAALRSAPAPSEGWARLAAECADLFELNLEHFGVPITEEIKRRFLDGDAKVVAHRDQLVADYRAKARSDFRWP